MSQYSVLHYRGDLTGSEQAQPGAILGHDEAGRPYEVLDAEFEPCPECDPTMSACLACDETGGRTTVHLQYGTPEAIRAHFARLQADMAKVTR